MEDNGHNRASFVRRGQAVGPREAWNEGQVPIADAVTFGDGRMILLEVLHAEAGRITIRPIAETTFESFISYNPGWLAEVTCITQTELPSRGLLQSGEGAQGSDGFIALCDSSGELIYCLFCMSSNPFTKLSLSKDHSKVQATTSNGVEWSFDVDTPWKIDTRTTR